MLHMNLQNILQQKFDQYKLLISEFGHESSTTKAIFDLKKEIPEIAKAAVFDSAEVQQDFFSSLEQLHLEFLEKKKKMEAEAIEFTKQVEEQIIQIEKLYSEKKQAKPLEKSDYDELKQFLFNITNLLKTPKWQSKEVRNNIKDKLNQLKLDIKTEESKYYDNKRQERFENAVLSLEISDKIFAVLHVCHPDVAIEELQQLYQKFVQFIEPMELNKEAFAIELSWTEEKLKQTLKQKSEVFKLLKKLVLDNKEAFTIKDKNKLFEEFDKLKAELDKAWEQHKIELEKLQQERALKRQEQEQKKEEWIKKQEEFLTMMQEKLERQKSYALHLQKVLKDRNDFIQRLENRVVIQSDFKKGLQQQLKDLEDRQASAWTVEFIEKSNKWIAEKQDKIAEIDKEIAEVKEKKQDVRASLTEVQEKLDKTNASISEIEEKINDVLAKLPKQQAEISSINQNSSSSLQP